GSGGGRGAEGRGGGRRCRASSGLLELTGRQQVQLPVGGRHATRAGLVSLPCARRDVDPLRGVFLGVARRESRGEDVFGGWVDDGHGWQSPASMSAAAVRP